MTTEKTSEQVTEKTIEQTTKQATESKVNKYHLSYLTILAIVISDQLTKVIIDKYISMRSNGIVVIPNFFKIVHVRNLGAAWGIGSDHPQLLTIISVLLLILIIIFRDHLIENNHIFAIAMSLIIAGTIGNLTDRIFRQGVVDFLCFHFKEIWYYPSFNIADSAICIGVTIYIGYSFLFAKHDNVEANNAEAK